MLNLIQRRKENRTEFVIEIWNVTTIFLFKTKTHILWSPGVSICRPTLQIPSAVNITDNAPNSMDLKTIESDQLIEVETFS
jgi:hypothetical protein